MPDDNSNSKDLFVIRHFTLGGASAMLIGMENSGIIKIRYTDTEVEITLWDADAENVIHTMTCTHDELNQKKT